MQFVSRCCVLLAVLSALGQVQGLVISTHEAVDPHTPLPEKVKVEFFYEAQCPFCQRIIASSLKQFLDVPEQAQHVDLHLYPYGNAHSTPIEKVSEGYRYWHPELKKGTFVHNCQHGESECFGNAIHNCAIKHHPEKAFEFIACMEIKHNVSQEWSSFDCAKDLGLKIDTLSECARGTEGNLLMKEVGDITQTVNKSYVPWILLNGQHSDESELDGDKGNSGHFVNALCSQFKKEPKPEFCLHASEHVVTAPEDSSAVRSLSMLSAAVLLVALGRWQ